MKIEKYYCDICNNEIGKGVLGKIITIREVIPCCSNDYNKTYHFCDNCAYEVIESINEIIKRRVM